MSDNDCVFGLVMRHQLLWPACRRIRKGERRKMLEEHIKQIILGLLGQIAPEADANDLKPGERFRNQFQFDSVDFLNFALALEEQLHIKIPEMDFPHLATLNGCIEYLTVRCHAEAPARPRE
jgi:acyl carrier protein